jgi:hypothetical protein
MLPAIPDIARAIKASRAEFGRVFLQVQVDYVSNPLDRQEFEAVAAQSGGDAEAFAQALRVAQAGGWLEPIVHALINESLEDGRLAAALASDQQAGSAALQAIANVAAGFAQPELLYRGVVSGMRWTVKVLIDGTAKGTGILIGPHLVLTAWHVVQQLFRPDGNGGWKPDPDAAPKIQIEFDDFLSLIAPGGALVPRGSVRVAANKEWHVASSPCLDEELEFRLPDDLTRLEGSWDYAIIRLAKTPGMERRWAALDARAVVPKKEAQFLVFQHPAGHPLLLGQGDILAPAATAAAAIPRLRFLHAVNTVGGSSGGPCFDKTFMLFGLHQGVWQGALHGGRPINRGIPVVRVIEDIKKKIENLPVPDPSESPIWHVVVDRMPHPVIGCDAFQTLVWKSALAGTPRIILLTGERGTGKSFRLAVLSGLLADAGHLKVVLPAELISKLPAQKLAEKICQTAGAGIPAIPPLNEVDSTPATWLKDEVVPSIVAALDSVRNARLVWIALADLNRTDIDGELASELLSALYEQTKSIAWLRVVLDGMKGDVPDAVRKDTERHRTAPPTIDELTTYVRRAIAELDVPQEATIRFGLRPTERDYPRWLDENAATATARLAERAMEIVSDYQAVVSPDG